ncbi:MAG: translocation/assembly module TamB domain-containing protein [Proteobacteria bacterium]|nr:translocation/assembly module TamB domain-containing protein [Pseudomonadota bacterium]
MSETIKTRKWIKRAAMALGVLLLLCLITVGGLLALLRSETGRQRIVEFVNRTASSESFQLRLRGLAGNPPWQVSLEGFLVSDRRGVWLSGRDLSVSWDLSSLAGGRLVFPEIELKELVLARLPQGDEKPAGPIGPIKLPGLPRLEVGRLTVRRLRLPAPSAAPPRDYALEGGARLEKDSSRVEIVVTGLAPASGELHATARLAGRNPDLEIDLRLREPAGGALGSLLGLPATSDIQAALTGAGPLTQWRASLDASASGLLGLRSTWALGLDRILRLEGRGRLTAEPGLLPESAARYLGRAADFELNLGLDQSDDKSDLAVERLTVRTGRLDLLFQGGADLAGGGLRGTFDLEAPEPSILAPIGLVMNQPLKIQGRVSGTIPGPRLELRTETGPWSYQGLSAGATHIELDLEPAGALPPISTGLRSAGRIRLTGLAIPGPQPAPENLNLDFEAVLDGTNRLHVERLDIDGGWLRARAKGQLGTGDLDLESRLEVELDDLKRLTVTGLKLSGRAELRADVKGLLTGPRLGIEGKGRLAEIKGLPGPAAVLAGGSIDLDFQADYREKRLDLKRFEARGRSILTATGLIDHGAERLDLKASLTPSGLPALAADQGIELKKPGIIKLQASGPFKNLKAEVQGGAEELRYQGRVFQDLRLKAAASDLPAAPQGDLSVDASSPAGPIAITAAWAWTRGKARVRDGRVRMPGVELTADLDYDPAGPSAEGNLRLRAADLEPVSRILGSNLSGSVDLDVDLKPESGRPGASVKGRAVHLVLDGVRLGSATIEGNFKDLNESPAGQARLDLKQLEYQDLVLDRASLTLSGSARALAVNAEASGSKPAPLKLKTRARISRETGTDRVVLESLAGRLAGRKVRLERPATLEKRGDELTLRDLDLSVGQGRIKGRLGLSPENADIDLDVQNLPLDLAEAFRPLPVTGLLDARIQGRGRPDSPGIEAVVALKDLRPGGSGPTDFKPVRADLRVEAVSGLCRADLKAGGLGPRPVQGRVELPLALSLRPWSARVPPQGTLSGNLAGGLDLGLLPALFFLDGHNISGLADLDLSLTGRIDDPVVSGRLSVNGARYENVKLGTVLTGISVEATADGPEIRLIRAEASDGVDGRLTARGRLQLDPTSGYPYEAEIGLRSARLVNLNMFHGQASGDLKLSGRTGRADFGGTLVVDPAELTIPRRLPPSLTELEVTQVNLPPTGPKPRTAKPTQGTTLQLDVRVEMPGRFFVRGRGMDSEWKGRLDVRGPAGSPVIQGQLDMVRGRFDFLDRRFKLTQGSLTFIGSNPPTPVINVAGQTRVQDVDIIVKLSGSTSAPQISLDSQPALPSDEVLARLLFGRSLDKITPWQALQLASAAQTLAGGGTDGLDVLDRTRKALGVDRVEVKQGDEGQTSVGVGKYLSDKIYVEVDKGFQAGGDQVSVELELTPSLSLETEVGGQSGSGIGINWKRDY